MQSIGEGARSDEEITKENANEKTTKAVWKSRAVKHGGENIETTHHLRNHIWMGKRNKVILKRISILKLILTLVKVINGPKENAQWQPINTQTATVRQLQLLQLLPTSSQNLEIQDVAQNPYPERQLPLMKEMLGLTQSA